MKKSFKVSVIIPVYNEEKTILQVVKKVQKLTFRKEIIIVNDGSRDKTAKKLENLRGREIIILSHSKNKGKGAAIKTGLKKANGEIIAIQDADLEYSPGELETLIKPVAEGRADVVYGSRFLTTKHPFSIYYLGNRFLTYLTSLLFFKKVTDMETGHKVFRKDILDSFKIRANHFDLEPEITAKILKRKIKFLELPISYKGRSRKEGKKITWKDGLKALIVLLRYRLFD